MLKNYIIIAFRNILKNKTVSIINILGLAVGIAVCLLIFQYALFEFSYDKFHVNYNNLFSLLNFFKYILSPFSFYTDNSYEFE